MNTDKFAILLDCDPDNSLGGSVTRDLKNIHFTLRHSYDIVRENIYVLYSSNKVKNAFVNICKNSDCLRQASELRSVISYIKKKCNNPDLLYIHITGHGYQKQDINNDEKDGMDEFIRINDSNVIDDDELYNILKQNMIENCKIRITVDTCHSGTMSDFKYKIDGDAKIDVSNSNAYFKDAYSLSACSDNELSMCDISDIGYGGSLTVHLLDNKIALDNFLLGDPKITMEILSPILKKLHQTPELLCDY